MDIRKLGPGDEPNAAAASHVFDGPAKESATRGFLGDEGHHLLVAYVGGDAPGFVTGVEMTHPDKGKEMFLYELAVEESSRRGGIGRRLVDALKDLARERGCYGMWVVTDAANGAALATYEGSGGVPERRQVVRAWTF